MVEELNIEPTVIVRGDYKETLFCDIMISEKLLEEKRTINRVSVY